MVEHPRCYSKEDEQNLTLGARAGRVLSAHGYVPKRGYSLDHFIHIQWLVYFLAVDID